MYTQNGERDENKIREVTLSGFDLIKSPRLNKGTAVSDEESDAFDLHGLLPPHIGTLKEQMEKRRMQALGEQPTPLQQIQLSA